MVFGRGATEGMSRGHIGVTEVNYNDGSLPPHANLETCKGQEEGVASIKSTF